MHAAQNLALAVALLVAGCATDGDVPTFAAGGTFTDDATQQQMEELADYVEMRGGDLLLMESFPVQFRATGLSEEACEELRIHAQERSYVQHVRACEEEGAIADGDAPSTDQP